jgi:hypothetical protein
VSAPACATHPERPALAGCAECGALLCAECRHVAPDGLSRCAACLGQPAEPLEERPAEAPATPAASSASTLFIPWERPEGTAIGAFWATAREAASGPLRFMERVPWRRRDLRTPLVFALLCGTLGYTIATLLAVSGLGWPTAPISLFFGVPESAGRALLVLPTVPLQVTFEVVGSAALSYLAFRVAKVPTASYEATFRAYAYASAPRLLLGLPGGQLLVTVVELMMVISGFRAAHGLTTRQALVGFIPQALLFLAAVGLGPH